MVETKRNYLYPNQAFELIDHLKKEGPNQKRVMSRLSWLQTVSICRLMYEHGLRLGEAVSLKWNHNLQSTPNGYRLIVQRQKGSKQTDQPVKESTWAELQALQQIQARFWLDKGTEITSNWVFLSVLNPLAHITGQLPGLILNKAMKEMGWDLDGSTKLFKHATGIKLAQDGYSMDKIRDWLGHHHVGSTEFYLKFAPGRENEHPFKEE